MASTGLKNGPYSLTTDEIDRVVTRTSPGVYILDRENSNETFIVNYVGRSDDDDVNNRLKDWVDTKYLRFKFDYYDSVKLAFEKECHIWHDFGGPDEKMDNEKHPQRPQGTNWQCPACNLFERRW